MDKNKNNFFKHKKDLLQKEIHHKLLQRTRKVTATIRVRQYPTSHGKALNATLLLCYMKQIILHKITKYNPRLHLLMIKYSSI